MISATALGLERRITEDEEENMAEQLDLFGCAVGGNDIKAPKARRSEEDAEMHREEDAEYLAFTEKFKTKKTTDDCYTPPAVYEAVKEWAVKEYGLEGRKIMRPFFPGGDYEREIYPPGCVVIDNPPFSILSHIVKFYTANGIDFFLFAPTLTLYNIARGACNYIPTGKSVTYENGAEVATSFVTNMGSYKIDANAELAKALADANEASKPPTKTQAKLSLPAEVNTSSRCYALPMLGQTFRAKAEEVVFVAKLDDMAKDGRGIFGGGFIMNADATARYVEAQERAAQERAAQERAAQERAAQERAAFCYRLSERERALVAKKKEGANNDETDA